MFVLVDPWTVTVMVLVVTPDIGVGLKETSEVARLPVVGVKLVHVSATFPAKPPRLFRLIE